ncbi:MAG: glycosyltransferase family 2 protein [Deltaproteobacteria bacterium]|nr:glycosyltransferase family 2 protein [Deltaproteobacteria bacterium]
MTTAVITMGGIGKRFLDAGYTIPKYRIVVNGKSLFVWAMESLKAYIDDGSPFIFIVKKSDNSETFIKEESAMIGIVDVTVVEIDAATDGQATTALFAGDCISRTDPFFVYNIDTHIRPGSVTAYKGDADGWIPCFAGKGDAWSFVALDKYGTATEVREKVRISDNATLGLYWFSSYALYDETYQAYYGNHNGAMPAEKYIAPMYNYLISNGRKVTISTIKNEDVIPLGTPEEVSAVEAVHSC